MNLFLYHNLQKIDLFLQRNNYILYKSCHSSICTNIINEEIYIFYNILCYFKSRFKSQYIFINIEDLNSNVGKEEKSETLGKYGFKSCNKKEVSNGKQRTTK